MFHLTFVIDYGLHMSLTQSTIINSIMTEHCLLLHNPSQDGATPLFIASEKGHSTIVDLLLRHEADPNIARNVS